MKKIVYKGIKTNNLKNIDVFLEENEINCITGPSGSGKSSLAFETISQISDDQFQRLKGNEMVNSNYLIEMYENIKISASLKQTNFNKNPRSTIATYYGLDKYFSYLFSVSNNVSPAIFSFNRYSSACPSCKGLGYEKVIDESKLINSELKLKNMPFVPWKKSKNDYYRKILEIVCNQEGINLEKKFIELSEEEQFFLTYGEGKNKIKISFKQGNRQRTKTDYFKGVFRDIESKIKKEPNQIKEYLKKVTCRKCHGGRYNKSVLNYKLIDKNIKDIYLLSIEDLQKWLNKIIIDELITEYSLVNKIKKIIEFLNNLIDLKLGYLNLNRSIASLSGGEFQRLRLSQMLNSDFNNILFVLDEPLNSLHAEERNRIEEKINLLKKKNTFLVVEHNLNFIKNQKNIITLSKSGRTQGGYKIRFKEYLAEIENNSTKKRMYKGKKIGKISLESYVNNVKPFELPLIEGTIIGLAGYSGSGKTTFLREILPVKLNKYKYISQKPINGNSYSTIASYLGILDEIKLFFSKEHKVDKSLFSYHPTGSGSCSTCKGKGEIEVELKLEDKIKYVCPKCEGKRYQPKTLSLKCYGYNIYEALSLEALEAARFFKEKDEKIFEKIEFLNKIGLGYLPLNQSISSLSGGEAQRVKLLRFLVNSSTVNVFGLDEPFQGLNDKEISMIIDFLYGLVEKGKTIYIAEHNLYALKLSSYIIEFGKYSGKKGGEIIYFGTLVDIKDSSTSIIKEYL